MRTAIDLNQNQVEDLKRLLQSVDFSASIARVSIVGRFFQWVDDNILDKTSRLWMYILEISGIVVIGIIIHEFTQGLNMIENAQTDLELKRAEMFMNNVRDCITPIAAMVSTICAALPTVMGVFRSLKNKWQNGHAKPDQMDEET